MTPDEDFFQACVYRDFVGNFGDRDFITDYFRRHVEAVKAAVPAHRLLVYEVAEGWEPLCRFLGVPEPGEADFPHVNVRADFEAMIAGMQQMLAAGPGGMEAVRQGVAAVHEKH